MKSIVYDIGTHKGLDAAYYLQKGYKVIAVEANPELCESLREKFSNEITNGQMILVESAIDRYSNISVPFHISSDDGESSLAAERLKEMNRSYKTISVNTNTLTDLFNEFGRGVYCKMDIENGDIAALKTLNSSDNLPQYFSVEISGLPIGKLVQQLPETQAAIKEFERLGYNRFKLVDQYTLASLSQKPFYVTQRNILFRARHQLESIFKIPSVNFSPRHWYSTKFNYDFTMDTSGPFGEDLVGKWYTTSKMKQIIHERFEEYYELEKTKKHNIFWVDLHATW
jgi:FkbM family methyltransferase